MDAVGYGVVGLLLGAAVVAFVAIAVGRIRTGEAQWELREKSTRVMQLEAQVSTLQSGAKESMTLNTEYQARNERLQAQLEEREAAHSQRLIDLEKKEHQIRDTFAQLSQQVLAASTEQLTLQAKAILEQYRESAAGDLTKKQQAMSDLIGPIQENLKKIEATNVEMEKQRNTAYGELLGQVKGMTSQQDDLKKETNRLIRALQDPGTAGQWGEMVLQRVIELAGLTDHVDFEQQVTSSTDEGKQRPDVTVSLPGSRKLIIDSKASMKAYTESLEAPNEEIRQNLLRTHATKVMERVKELKRKNYPASDQMAVEFTVMFIPSESAFRAALEARPSLLEEAMENTVVIASPASLLGLLRAVAYGWKQDSLAQNARKIQEDANRLYESICTLAGHYSKLGKSLAGATDAYNDFGGSLDRTLIPAARRFRDMGVSSNRPLIEVPQLAFDARDLRATEFFPLGEIGGAEPLPPPPEA